MEMDPLNSAFETFPFDAQRRPCTKTNLKQMRPCSHAVLCFTHVLSSQAFGDAGEIHTRQTIVILSTGKPEDSNLHAKIKKALMYTQIVYLSTSNICDMIKE